MTLVTRQYCTFAPKQVTSESRVGTVLYYATTIATGAFSRRIADPIVRPVLKDEYSYGGQINHVETNTLNQQSKQASLHVCWMGRIGEQG